MPEFFYFVCVGILCKSRMLLLRSATKRDLHLQAILAVVVFLAVAVLLVRQKRNLW